MLDYSAMIDALRVEATVTAIVAVGAVIVVLLLAVAGVRRILSNIAFEEYSSRVQRLDDDAAWQRMKDRS